MTVRKVDTSGTRGMGLGICGGLGAADLVEAARAAPRVEDEDWKMACCWMESEEGERTARRCWGRRSGWREKLGLIFIT